MYFSVSRPTAERIDTSLGNFILDDVRGEGTPYMEHIYSPLPEARTESAEEENPMTTDALEVVTARECHTSWGTERVVVADVSYATTARRGGLKL